MASELHAGAPPELPGFEGLRSFRSVDAENFHTYERFDSYILHCDTSESFVDIEPLNVRFFLIEKLMIGPYKIRAQSAVHFERKVLDISFWPISSTFLWMATSNLGTVSDGA